MRGTSPDEKESTRVHHTEARRGGGPSHVGVGQPCGGPGSSLSECTAQAHLEPPLEVPTISQWSHHYSGLALAQTAGTKTLPRPHCGTSTWSRRGTHTQPQEPPSHRLTQELTWTLGCKPTGWATSLGAPGLCSSVELPLHSNGNKGFSQP